MDAARERIARVVAPFAARFRESVDHAVERVWSRAVELAIEDGAHLGAILGILPGEKRRDRGNERRASAWELELGGIDAGLMGHEGMRR